MRWVWKKVKEWLSLVKNNEMAWKIWHQLNTKQKASIKKGRYPEALLNDAVKRGYNKEKLREGLRDRARRYT